jgi:hypothetical protein
MTKTYSVEPYDEEPYESDVWEKDPDAPDNPFCRCWETSVAHQIAAALNLGMIFLVYVYDDHGDPEFYVYKDVMSAMHYAREQVAVIEKHYGDMPVYTSSTQYSPTLVWGRYGEERWRVEVHKLVLR